MSTSSSANLLTGKLLFPFIAPPNGGKGTQTQILSQRYNLPTFDMGASFRAIMKEGKDPVLKAELESYMNNGKLVPIETVVKVFKTNFEDLASQHPTSRGFILDGFPRNKEQADALSQLCTEWQAKLAKVIYLHVGMDVVKQRATGRRFCSKNARHVYNVNDTKLAPKVKKLEQNREIWFCDIDGAELIIRPDDESETVEKRLQEYKKETDPLIEYFKGTQQLVEINGEQDPSLVTQAIEAEIQPLLGLSPTS
ncbi:MAG: adenylate kinase [Vampirovibrio sp.]|jgi:adenylate kinase|nr:adenylate kinase [Vampirovibrio sp.]